MAQDLNKTFEFTVTGIEEARGELASFAGNFAMRIGPALRRLGEELMTEAKRRTPVDTGTLKNSGHVTGPGFGRELEVSLKFGGPAAPYALYVHENLQTHHTNGEAKFLERPILEAASRVSGLAQRLAEEIRRGL